MQGSLASTSRFQHEDLAHHIMICAGPFIVGRAVSLALANPDMLSKHPGYPMGKAVDPVKGQPLANDPGQTNASGENALVGSAAFDDARSSQHLSIKRPTVA